MSTGSSQPDGPGLGAPGGGQSRPPLPLPPAWLLRAPRALEVPRAGGTRATLSNAVCGDKGNLQQCHVWSPLVVLLFHTYRTFSPVFTQVLVSCCDSGSQNSHADAQASGDSELISR